MKLLDLLERAVERVVRTPIDSMFRQEIQPAEIERSLERAMRDNSRRASGVTIMPNAYTVHLADVDFAAVEPYLVALTRRLESWLANQAESQEGTMLDRIRVEIVESADVGRRRPRIDARITDIRGTSTASRQPYGAPVTEQTQMFRVARSEPSVRIRFLTGRQSGQESNIAPGTSVVGRSRDVDIRIDAPEVSRRHFQIDRNGVEVTIRDLGSTNGTRVNGKPVTRATVRNGDEIQVGTQSLRIVIAS